MVVGGLAAIGHHGVGRSVSPAVVLGLAVGLVVLAFLPPLHLELRRHACWVTLSEVGLLVGWLVAGPFAVVGAATFAEAAATIRQRQPALKAAFNLVHTTCAVVVATAVFAVLAPSEPLSASAWGAGAAALAVRAVFDTVVTAAILSFSEDRPVAQVLRELTPTAIIAFCTTASLGISSTILLHHDPLTVLLLVPVIGMLVLGTRGVAAQRAERLRVERLYAASSRLAPLAGLSDTLMSIAAEAREIGTGSAAICCAADATGVWTGVIVDDRGTSPASRRTMDLLRSLAGAGGYAEVALTSLPRPSRQALPAANHLVCVSPQADRAAEVVLAVLREIPQDDQGERRTQALRAFASQAVTVVANVLLYEEVQDALRRQIDLNRQKDEFVATVSHELRTPLTSMIASIQTMQRLADRIEPEARQNLTDIGLSQGRRLKRLIEDLLMVAATDQRSVRCDVQPVDVPEFVSELAEEFAAAAGHRLRVEVAPGTAAVLTDRDKLRRILVNLVENAVKYAPDGWIDVHAEQSDDQLRLSVSDEGPGIPPADRERVFQRFMQLDQSSTRRQGGTGLGLHLSRELASVLSGRLSVTDAPSGGARFLLVLPARPSAAGAPVANPGAYTSGSVNKRPAGINARPASFAKRDPEPAAVT